MKTNEKAYLNEEEKKFAKKSEEELKVEEAKILKAEKQKEYVKEEESISNDLQKLRDLLEKHVIDDALVQKVMNQAELEHDEIEEIFEKIDEIENMEDIDDYLPKDMRVTKEEYAAATHDDAVLTEVVTKIERCLGVLAQHTTTNIGGSINIFSGFLSMLDKNLITIQEHHIDMKDALQPNKKSKGIWDTIKEGFQ